MTAPVVDAPDLRALSFFTHLPESAIRTLGEGLKKERVPQGVALCGPVQPAHGLTILCSGEAECSSSGSRDLREKLRPGDWFGADAVLLGSREERTIIASEPVELATISRESIDQILRHALRHVLGDPPDNVSDAQGSVRPGAVGRCGRPRVGLALSGGGAKAFAHLGVLKVLEEAGVQVDVVAGTSAGAIAAAMLCAGKPLTVMFSLAEELRRRVLRREGMWDFLEPPAVGLIRGERTQALYDQILDSIHFHQLQKPLAIPAADLLTGEKIIFRAGLVSEAIRASAGIPGLYAPWPYAGRYLVEGGLVEPLPVDLARRMGAGLVIACDVAGCPQEVLGEMPEVDPPNWMGLIAARVSAILETHTLGQSTKAEILIRPEIKDYEVLDYPLAEDLISLGESAARSALPEIRETLARPGGAANG